jgi:hypothetical protein
MSVLNHPEIAELEKTERDGLQRCMSDGAIVVLFGLSKRFA